jgi:hypothetical protein
MLRDAQGRLLALAMPQWDAGSQAIMRKVRSLQLQSWSA